MIFPRILSYNKVAKKKYLSAKISLLFAVIYLSFYLYARVLTQNFYEKFFEIIISLDIEIMITSITVAFLCKSGLE